MPRLGIAPKPLLLIACWTLATWAAACTKFKTPVSADGGDASEGGDVGHVPDASDAKDASTVDSEALGDASDQRPMDPAPGTVLWARSTSSVSLTGVARSSTGVVVGGYMSAPVNLGGTLMAPMGATDAVVAQFSAVDGAYLFASRFGGSSPAGTGGVYGFLNALDPAGAPLVYGVSYCDPSGAPACNKVDVGLGLQDPGGGAGGLADGFVGRYSVSTGQPTWVARLAGMGDEKIVATTSGSGDSLYVAGLFDQEATLSIGTATRTFTAGGYRDVLIFEAGASTGTLGPTRVFGGPGFEQPSSLAWAGSSLIAAGFFNLTSVFGDFTLTSTDFDVWVVKLAPADLRPLWAIRLGGPGADKNPYIVTDSAGDVYVSAFVTGTATLGSFPVGGAGGTDVFLAKLRGSDGQVMWAKSLGSAGDDSPAGIAFNPSGQVVMAANIAGPLEVNGPWFGGSDAALVSYGTDGNRAWTKVVGTTGQDTIAGVVWGGDAFYAPLNLGADPGGSIDGVPIDGPVQARSLLAKIHP